ncbi:MAG: molybdopterin biosynthesis protein [Methanothrix sp.]|nr:molybdopterin biosynthesis protein [Methanothrix sp.]
MPKEFHSLIPLDAAKSIVLQHLPAARIASVPLSQAAGSILAEKIVSTIDVPGFSRASMDGFAVQAEDTIEAREDRPISLRLVGRVAMGRLPGVEISSGEAAEVSTGSMIPPGADAVVMIEHSQATGEKVLVRRPVYASENIQAAGSDISFGETLLYPGTLLQPREIGVLAALGCQKVPVRMLKVGVASTGDELAPPGENLAAGKIYDINTYTIAAAVADCGAEALHYGILPDEKQSMTGALQKMAGECDLILVSGSTSAGAGDMIYRVLEEMGELIFHGVNLKPGKPTIFGLIEGKPCLGLPGYPTSALTVFSCLAAPAIRAALGGSHRGKSAPGRLAGPVRTEGRRQMLAVGLSGDLVYPVDKGSGSITTLAGADGIIDIPAGVEYLEEGTPVSVELFAERDTDSETLLVAGENSIILEKLAESRPGCLRLLTAGPIQARIYLEEGVADLACVWGLDRPWQGTEIIWSAEREMGLHFRDREALSHLADRPLVGWQRDSSLKSAFETVLKEQSISSPRIVRSAKTHRAVAAAVASERADAGYAEKEAAEEAGLGFEFLDRDRIILLARSDRAEDSCIMSLLQALSEKEAGKSPDAAGNS